MYACTYMIEAFVSLILHTHMALPFIILCKPMLSLLYPFVLYFSTSLTLSGK
ncbi:uncharacterized protein DS421_16g541630 [Arachis hypogaea]|nr:uncharacterized protein DS421_16g541630 [Arachis hypogaea]